MKAIPHSADRHDGTGVDLTTIGMNADGLTLCPVCFCSILGVQLVGHLDRHADRNERIDRPKVAL